MPVQYRDGNLAWVFCTTLLCLFSMTGCDTPIHHRGHISGDLLVRTGHDLGPPKSPCDLVIDQLVDWTDGLSEEEAILVGLWNNPAYDDWQLALQQSQLADQEAKLRGDVARIAEARLAAGDVGELEVSAIRLDALVGVLMNLFLMPSFYCVLGRVNYESVVTDA